MEMFSGDVREIKITLSLNDDVAGRNSYVEYYITCDYFNDLDDEDRFWGIFRKRIDAIDRRLQELGISIVNIDNRDRKADKEQ